MALYRCPKCGEIAVKNAKRCINCGLFFDLNHEPVLDDGSGKPESVRKKEKRAKIIAIIIVVIVLVGALIWAFVQKGFLMRYGWR